MQHTPPLSSPERRGSDSFKWGRYARPNPRGRDVLPMWIADMDFAAPDAVLHALHQRVDHGVFGYASAPDAATDAVLAYLKQRHALDADASALVWLPGLVPALSVCARAAHDPGAAAEAIIMPPVYPPFFQAPADGGCAAVHAPLRRDPDTLAYHLDFDALDRAASPRTRLLILCNPHNPVGRAWPADDIAAVADFCAQRGILLCSDEIHCDLILDEHLTHTTAARHEGRGGLRTVTLMAPSKTYNIPGLGCAFALIPDADLRKAFRRAMGGFVPHPSPLAYAAGEAAYRHGEPWRQALLAELRRNRDTLRAAIQTTPGLRMSPVQATYLAWIDTTHLNHPGHDSAYRFFLDDAGIAFASGSDFGDPNHLRLNFGCPHATLLDATQRLHHAVTHP